jgi:hypothetical protein
MSNHEIEISIPVKLGEITPSLTGTTSHGARGKRSSPDSEQSENMAALQ